MTITSAAPVVAGRASTTQELVHGTMVNEYRVEGKLGEGGMGQVFAAIHPVIGKRAAIKVIRAEHGANPEAVERFVQEARAVNQIGHPNIVDVFAFGELPDGRPYLMMEWLKGESLSERLKRKRMTWVECCDVLDSVCRALEAAHAERIIHRDLKPDNVFLAAVKGEKPLVKLLDFGIAKLIGTDDTRLERTATGAMLGTPRYISPEQARGRHVDAAADVYSLGAMAFEMFTGQPPFIADNAMDMIAQHLHDDAPSAREVDPVITPAVDDLLSSMLDKDASARPSLAHVREVLAEARKVTPSAPAPMPASEPAAAAAPAAPSSHLWKWALGGLAVAGVGAAVVLAMNLKSGDPTPTPAPALAVVNIDAGSAPRIVAPPDAAVPVPEPAVDQKVVIEIKGSSRARVEVDGKVVLRSGTRIQLPLSVGPHTVSVSAPGRRSEQRPLEVVADRPNTLTVRLERGKPTPPAVADAPPKPPKPTAPDAGVKAQPKPPKPPDPPADDPESLVNPFPGRAK